MDTSQSEPKIVHAGRGDAKLEIDGQVRVLSLTLGAMAEMEAGLEVQGFAALGEALKSLNGQSMTCVLGALLKAGGASDGAQLALKAHPGSAAKAIAACFKANTQ